jgi:hypothetical protein
MSEIDPFLADFFGTANDLSVESAHVATLAETARQEWPEVPIALPRVGDERAPGMVRWYVLSPAASEDARLAEELGAWIGPTYSAAWTGQAAELEMADPIDRAAAELGGGTIFVIDIEPKDREAARENLGQLRNLWQERPRDRAGLPLRASELLRDFNLSLANGNPQTAREILGKIKRRALLSAENELFLEIAVLESEGRWIDLASHPRLADVSARRRPWSVTRALLRGLYRTKLAGAEEAEDLGRWIDQAGELESSFPGLFSTRGALDEPEVAKAFALVDRAHPSRPLRTRVRVLEAKGLSVADRAFLNAVVDPREPPVSKDPLETARRLVADGNYDPAWDHATNVEAGPERTAILVQCAVELATVSAAREALDALEALRADDVETLLQGSRRLSRDVEDLKTSLILPTDGRDEAGHLDSWPDWFRALHARQDWPEGVKVAEKGALEWSGEDLLAGDGDELADLVRHRRTPTQERLFLEAAPSLLEWLTQFGTSPALVGIKKAFLEAVCLGDLRSDVALETALAVSESIIDSGVDPAEYDEILANLEAIWHAHASVRSIPWLADCFEVLADLPGDRAVLTEVATRMIGVATAAIVKADHLSADQLTEAAGAIGIEKEAIPSGHAGTGSSFGGEVMNRLEGARVGLYTLSPHVGARVKQKLESNFPAMSVVVNSDTKSTDRLRALAHSADRMIVMLRSATHAATDAIAASRPGGAPTLRVGCRGSSGVVAAFLDSVQAST